MTDPYDRTAVGWQRYVPLLLAAAAIAARLPFLAHAADFFNSDEAVEGLMARHLRDLPVFFWGQSYKGVPEVYLTGLVFLALGSGVAQLKLVTLIIWSAAVGVTARLAQTWYGTLVAIIAGLMLVTGPPAVVTWSLSANAEVAWLTLFFSGALLAYQASSPLVFVLCGLSLWIHPIALPGIAALGMVAALRSGAWRTRRDALIQTVVFGRGLDVQRRIVLLTLNALAMGAFLAFLVTFFGRSLNLAAINAAHPHKILRLALGLSAVAVLAHGLAGAVAPRRLTLRALGWLAVGLLPVEIYVLRGGIPTAAIINRRVEEMPALFADFAAQALPIVFGAHDSATVSVAPWWLVLPSSIALGVFVIDLAWRWRRCRLRNAPPPQDAFMIVAAVLLLAMLLPGGTYADVQSYRYVMPYFGLLAMSVAEGCRILYRANRAAGAIVTSLIFAGFIVGEYRWYSQLHPDSSDRDVIACMRNHGIHTATADYWIAYKTTFIADERVLVLPDDGPGRYVQYNRMVDPAGAKARVDRASSDDRGR